MGADFATNIQEVNQFKMIQWRVDTDRWSHRDEELIAIENLKHEDMLLLDRREVRIGEGEA
jgi:hypothetical protein